jgi:hypothetical protein
LGVYIEMKAIKYRHKWAWGVNKWEYNIICFDDSLFTDADLEEVIDYIQNDNGWSDKYRGIEYELVDSVPEDWVRAKLDRYQVRLDILQKNMKNLQGLLNKF